MSPLEARRAVGHPDIVERLRAVVGKVMSADRDTLLMGRLSGNDLNSMRDAAAEIDRLRTALRAVRASPDPRWQAQIISDALRETP